jgi:hypothetical protein
MYVRVRDMENGEIVSDTHFEFTKGRYPIATTFGKDSTTIQVLASGNELGTIGEIYILNTFSGVVIDSIALPKTDGRIATALQHPDRIRWILGDWYGLFVFNLETNQTDTIYTNPKGIDSIGHHGGPTWIGISEDQRVIYTNGQARSKADSPFRLSAWEVSTRKLVYQNEIGFTPVSNPPSRVVTQWERTGPNGNAWRIDLYDLSTGTFIRSVPGTIPLSAVYFSLSEDGNVLAYRMDGLDFPLRFVNTETGIVMGEFKTSDGFLGPIIQFLPGPALGVFLPEWGLNSIRLRIDPTTDVPVAKPQDALQCTVHPNPSDGSVVISVVVTSPTTVSMRLVATDGKVVKETAFGMLNEGAHSVPVHAPAGQYVCMISDGRETTSIPVIIR